MWKQDGVKVTELNPIHKYSEEGKGIFYKKAEVWWRWLNTLNKNHNYSLLQYNNDENISEPRNATSYYIT